MPHIHTEPGQHDLTASAFIVRIDGDTPKILLHMHKKLNTWLPMGGHVELHETPWASIIHEIKEESGYDISQLQVLQPKNTITNFGDLTIAHPMPFAFATYPFSDSHHHTDTCFAFAAKEGPRHTVSEGESTTLRLFTREELNNLPTEQIFPNTLALASNLFDHVLKSWRPTDPEIYSTASPQHNT